MPLLGRCKILRMKLFSLAWHDIDPQTNLLNITVLFQNYIKKREHILILDNATGHDWALTFTIINCGHLN